MKEARRVKKLEEENTSLREHVTELEARVRQLSVENTRFENVIKTVRSNLHGVLSTLTKATESA